MAHKSFTDRAGRRWDAWTVTPAKVEWRDAGGWLCFETRGEKRRLAPFPANWDDLTDDELCALCASAELASPPRRLVE